GSEAPEAPYRYVVLRADRRKSCFARPMGGDSRRARGGRWGAAHRDNEDFERDLDVTAIISRPLHGRVASLLPSDRRIAAYDVIRRSMLVCNVARCHWSETTGPTARVGLG
ncbi:MAG TPA: hypothetical protein VGK18_08935, partial [Propionicimonas sp.]|uniref:hypothetical protein n=1 Tax=Propionicimonas sp. TaxID=1955623 RepID=UPI002F42FF19